jgi:hypothetical protein
MYAVTRQLSASTLKTCGKGRVQHRAVQCREDSEILRCDRRQYALERGRRWQDITGYGVVDLYGGD